MAIFLAWLIHRDAATALRLLEHADFFNPADYNAVFNTELEKLIRRIQDPTVRQQVSELKSFDWAGYLHRALRKAGFGDDDLQEAFHDIAIKLLVKPGKLFQGWQPHRHGPLIARFRRSVANAILNVQDKTWHRRKLMTPTDPSILSATRAARRPYSGLLDEFRQLVSQKLGKLALAIFDQRTTGGETRQLVGRADLGNPTAHRVKQEVQSLKQLAGQFAAASGDANFVNIMDRAMEQERETVAKRRQATAAPRSQLANSTS